MSWQSGKRMMGPALNNKSKTDDMVQASLEIFEALNGRTASEQELAEFNEYAKELAGEMLRE